jgi:hypothetical protein
MTISSECPNKCSSYFPYTCEESCEFDGGRCAFSSERNQSFCMPSRHGIISNWSKPYTNIAVLSRFILLWSLESITIAQALNYNLVNLPVLHFHVFKIKHNNLFTVYLLLKISTISLNILSNLHFFKKHYSFLFINSH